MGRAGVPTGIGLGWVHLNQPEDPDMIIEKTGGGAGYNTYIALSPSRHTGLFVAATDGRHAGVDIFHESNAVLTYLAGATPTPETYMQLAAQDSHPEPAMHRHHKHTSSLHRTGSVSGN
jgi:D-alanyl-D-alanine-carboxypeptidase/D-alanyl-D-alanine-endopeptidase